jgi:hypothetical protein
MDWMIAWGCVLAVAFVLAGMRVRNVPELTDRQAIWVAWGMAAGFICWAVAAGMGYRLETKGANTIAACTLIGGLPGWLAARVFHAERD